MAQLRTITRVFIAMACLTSAASADVRTVDTPFPPGRPLALASGDFNADGLEDVAVAFDDNGRGYVVLLYANLAARIGPSRVAADPAPLLIPAETVTFPVAPEKLVAADLDNDGRIDLAGAPLGAVELVVLTGTSDGFSAPRVVPLEGTLTSLAAGEVNRRDGVADLVVAVQRPAGSVLQVFEGPRGALNAEPETIALDGPVDLLMLADLDGDHLRDIAAVGHERLTLLRGRDRRTSSDVASRALVSPVQTKSFAIGRTIRSMSLAKIQDGSPAADLLLHADDGGVLRLRGADPAGPFPAGAGVANASPQGFVTSIPMDLDGDARQDVVVLADNPAAPVEVHTSAAAATYFVTNTNDSGAGSLRQAILDANLSAGADEIRFSVSGTPPHLIAPTSSLPAIMEAVTLDATTQPGWSGAPLIDVSGDSLLPPANGITVWAPGVTIRGLGITGFDSHGIQSTDGYLVVEACRIGGVAFGPGAARNALNGLDLWGNGNRVGGPGALGNAVAGNVGTGIFLHGLHQGLTYAATDVPKPLLDAGTVTSTITVADRSTVQDVNVNVNLTHTWDSDLILTLIAPNGVRVKLAENRGLDGDDYTATTFDSEAVTPISAGAPPFTGSYRPEESLAALMGDLTEGSWTLEITDVAAQDSGTLLSWSLDLTSVRSVRNRVENNLIGTDAAGTQTPEPNLNDGLALENCDDTEIVGNTVSGHDGGGNYGVTLADSSFTVYQGNRVGTDLSGTIGLPNAGGVNVSGDSSYGTFGGTAPGAGNVFSASYGSGLRLDGSQSNVIQQNIFGLDASGSVSLGNIRGIGIVGGGGNLVGGIVPEARNLIAGNSIAGISIFNSPFGATIQGNWIGLNASGQVDPGQDMGLEVWDGTAVIIGGSEPGAGNVVSGNLSAGIKLRQPVYSTIVQGNIIGLDPTGTVLAGNGIGVHVDGSTMTLIGGNDPAEANRIAANNVGITIDSSLGFTETVSSTDTPLALPDVATMYSYLDVSAPAIPFYVQVTIDLTHTYVGDLSITLISPLGTRVLLVDRRGGSGANFSATTFEDDAASPIAAGTAPFSGTWIPEQPLHRILGRPASGVWTLEVVDHAAGDTGMLNSWNLVLYSAADKQTQIIGNRLSSNSFGIHDNGGGTLIDANSVCGNQKGLVLSGYGAGIFNNEIGECAGQADPNTDGMLITGVGNYVANNLVWGNADLGIQVIGGFNNRLSFNSIDANGGLGIDLGAAGPDGNDYQDLDGGANHSQNSPELLTTTPIDPANTQVSGQLHSQPGSTYQIELFGGDAYDPGGSGEGRDPLWIDFVTTDANGDAAFSWAVPEAAQYWSATATDDVGNTSEFSSTASIPGEASPTGDMSAGKLGAFVDVGFQPACGAIDHAIVWGTGPIAGTTAWTGSACGFGTSGSLQFTLPTPAPGQFVYFVVVGQSPSLQGSFGRDDSGAERPESSGLGSCDLVQTLAAVCP